MKYNEVMAQLKKNSNPRNVEGMARFGINPKNTFGISIPFLRALAKKIGKNHALALKLWKSGYHEARILASMIDEPCKVTEKQMDLWIKDFDSWDVCDQVCMNLFDKTPFVMKKVKNWSKRNREFEKRAAFALIAAYAWHSKDIKEDDFITFLNIIKRESTDERNYVKKAVNWALRQIGKKNQKLNKLAMHTAQQIQKKDSKAAQWIASDAIRELASTSVQKRLQKVKK